MESLITDIELNWNDPYDDLNFPVRIALVILICSSLCIGTILLVGIVMFERNGGDPQKRGFVNQLFSLLMVCVIVCYNFSMHCVSKRILVGPISSGYFRISNFVMVVFFFHGLSINIAIMFYRFLSIVVYKKVLPIVDDFAAMFVFFACLTFGFVMGFINGYTESVSYMDAQFVGQPSYVMSSTPLKFHLMGNFYFVFAIIVTILAIKIEHEKKIHLTEVEIAESQNNTATHNKDLMTTLLYIGILILIIISGLGSIFNSLFRVERYKVVFYLFQDLGHLPLIQIFLPLLLYNNNPELRHYVKNHIYSDLFR